MLRLGFHRAMLAAAIGGLPDRANLIYDLDPSSLLGAVAHGAGVASIADGSPSGFTATQATGVLRPTFLLNETGGQPALFFDGDYLRTGTATANTTVSIYAVLLPRDSVTGYVSDHSTSQNYGLTYASADTQWSYYNVPAKVLLENHVLTGYQIAHTVAGRTLATQWTFGIASSFTAPFQGSLARYLVFNGAHDAAMQAAVITYLTARYAIGSALVAPTLLDNNYATARGTHHTSSELARAVYTTSATSVTVESYDTAYHYNISLGKIGVFCNGAWVATIDGRYGYHSETVALPAGTDKVVEIVAGAQSLYTGTVRGTYIRGVSFNAAATPVTTENTPQIVVYGDSITGGSNATDVIRSGAWTLVRQAYSGSIAMEAWGSRSLKDDATDATARTAFTAQLAGYSPAILWLAIGTNDYGLNQWTAAAFGTAYADLLDKLHTALPAAAIYCQTPLTRTTETANGSGSTLGDYRTQIATAVSTRTGYCTLVDGTSISPTLDDGVHPNTAGHATYAAFIESTLGI